MRVVVVLAILFAVGYAAFAFKYIGSSKDRVAAHQKHVLTQLNRKPLHADSDNEGRTLKSEEAAVDAYGHRPVVEADDDEGELPDASDTAAYDQVIAEGGDVVDDDEEGGVLEAIDTANSARSHIEADREADEKHTVEAPSLAVGSRIEADRHAEEKRTVEAPGLAVGSRIEADRESEEKHKVDAPGLAVGSRIEPDSTAQRRSVVEPGGVAVTHAVKEPAADHSVHNEAKAPIDVAKIEPDSHQGTGGVKEPDPRIAKIEPDAHGTTAPVKEPGPRVAKIEPDAHAIKAPVREPQPNVERVEPDSHAQRAPVKAPEDKVPVIAPVIAPVISPVIAPVHHPDSAPLVNPHAKGLYAMEALDIDGKSRPLSEYAGKVTLVVNVASACGYTDENYKGLTKTYNKYRDHGLEILGFPCNQFGKQEPGDEKEIKSFCSTKYHVDFPMFSKIDVNGAHTHPVYQFLKRELPASEGGGGGTGTGKDLIWNFQKILVNHEGRPIRLFYQNWDQGDVEAAIYKALHEARAAGALKTGRTTH
ncbi:hypothetical protein HXX76_008605 [Chlamydomonas incerta]|uniref:Glutathione peroxidase n=1 Tax=Chlamydomonas incerta TaxID=51695 RepID=A0A835SZE0_CHLIN|nr:hypothetical protein HXX76_008605 [Chlamydomonas incerta]|eukprot:KAG2432873.1 hypothetical protein HXX76_008605 [Chlamydomonas incerta]